MELTNKRVLSTKLLIKKPEKKERITGSGIIIPQEANEVTSIGTVVIAGRGTELVPVPVKKGETVMFPPRSAIKVQIEEEDFFLINIQDVLLYW